MRVWRSPDKKEAQQEPVAAALRLCCGVGVRTSAARASFALRARPRYDARMMISILIAAAVPAYSPEHWHQIAERARAQADYYRCINAAASWFEVAGMADYSGELCQPYRSRFEEAARATIADPAAARAFIDQALGEK